MKNYKNYLIAFLTGLLVLSLSSHSAQAGGTSKEAKIIQYDRCLDFVFTASLWKFPSVILVDGYTTALQYCAKYQP